MNDLSFVDDGAMRPGEAARETLSGGGHVLVHDFTLHQDGSVVFRLGKTKTERRRRVETEFPLSQSRPRGALRGFHLHRKACSLRVHRGCH